MPSVDENKKKWGIIHDWPKGGSEWSRRWGTTDMQWYGCLLPRIHRYVPAKTILEIAPGYGRWSHYLKDLCSSIYLIDLVERCIEDCKKRFAEEVHVQCFVNDGRSLDMVPGNSIDFAFSFDSLVHVEDDVIADYLKELARTLTQDGVGFIHHSNLREYRDYLDKVERIPLFAKSYLEKRRWIDTNRDWRALSMDANRFEQLARDAGLVCINQEQVNWGMKRLNDCFSTFTRTNSRFAQPNQIMRNSNFQLEAVLIRQLSYLYCGENRDSVRRTRHSGRLRLY